MTTIYQKHWARPKHNFTRGQTVIANGHDGFIARTDPYSAWIPVQFTSGLHAHRNPVIIHIDDIQPK